MSTQALNFTALLLAVFSVVAASVLWSEGAAPFDSLSFFTGVAACAAFFTGHQLFTHPTGAHS